MDAVLVEEDDGDDITADDVDRKNIPYEADGQTKVIDRLPHMQTSSGQWRKVDAYGYFYVITSKRPEHCVITMWKEWQRSNASIRRRGLTEMKKLVDENATLLTQEVAVETLLQESKEKKRVDAIDKEKQKDLRVYRAQLKGDAKMQQDLDKEKAKRSYTWKCSKCKKTHTNYRCNVCENTLCSTCFNIDGNPCKCAEEGWEESVTALGPEVAPAPVELQPSQDEETVVAGVAHSEQKGTEPRRQEFVNPSTSSFSTKVANINQKSLERLGYSTIAEWLKADPARVYIGRAVNAGTNAGMPESKWRNTFSVKDHGRVNCLRKYKDYILRGIDQKGQPHGLLEDLEELRGKTLRCWCEPSRCHGHILLELLSERTTKTAGACSATHSSSDNIEAGKVVGIPSGLPTNKNASTLMKKQSWWPDNWGVAKEEAEEWKEDYWIKGQQGRNSFVWGRVHNVARDKLYRPCLANRNLVVKRSWVKSALP